MVLTMASPRPTPAWSVRVRSAPRWNGSVRVAARSGVIRSPVFPTVSTALPGRTPVPTHTTPCSGRLWTIALCTRFVAGCRRSACDPVVEVTSPRVSMATPCVEQTVGAVHRQGTLRRDCTARDITLLQVALVVIIYATPDSPDVYRRHLQMFLGGVRAH
jgi:hypothetical protein